MRESSQRVQMAVEMSAFFTTLCAPPEQGPHLILLHSLHIQIRPWHKEGLRATWEESFFSIPSVSFHRGRHQIL